MKVVAWLSTLKVGLNIPQKLFETPTKSRNDKWSQSQRLQHVQEPSILPGPCGDLMNQSMSIFYGFQTLFLA